MNLRVYRGGKPGGDHLAETINESTVGIRNKLGCMQWQHLMAQLATCVQCDGGHFKHVL
jgi:hypothetical protein